MKKLKLIIADQAREDLMEIWLYIASDSIRGADRFIDFLYEKGIDLLMKGLGPLETIRFINISRDTKIDSVKRHRKWQQQLKKDDFFNSVFCKSKELMRH